MFAESITNGETRWREARLAWINLILYESIKQNKVQIKQKYQGLGDSE